MSNTERQIELAKRILEANGYTVTSNQELLEGRDDRVLVASYSHMKYYAEPTFRGKIKITATSSTFKEKWTCGTLNAPLTIDALAELLRRDDIKRDPHSTMNFDNAEYYEDEIATLNKKLSR